MTNEKIPNILLMLALPSEGRGLLETMVTGVNAKGKINIEIEYFSVGKVNATQALTSSIYEKHYKVKHLDYVINLGSAGAVYREEDGEKNLKVGDVVYCDVAMQTDLDLRGIDPIVNGVKVINTIGTNKNELNRRVDNEAFHQLPNSNIKIDFLPKIICGSSDKFPIAYGDDWHQVEYEDDRKVTALDQELGAMAVVINSMQDKCDEKYDENSKDNIQPPTLISLKYITNVVDIVKNDDAKASGDEWLESLSKDDDCKQKLTASAKMVIEEIVKFESSRNKG